jgi:cell division septum initiation protein DivIVA
MDILFLIDKLEKLVQQSTKIPALNLRVVNEVEILEVIDQLRTTVPEEVKAARQIQGQKDRVIAQGKEEAERIVALARKHAEDLITAHEIARAAESRSHTIIERAQRDAVEIRRGADEYAQQVLSGLDQRVGQAHHQIRSGLIELEQRLNAGAEPASYETSEPSAASPSENKASGKAAEVLKFPSNKP